MILRASWKNAFVAGSAVLLTIPSCTSDTGAVDPTTAGMAGQSPQGGKSGGAGAATGGASAGVGGASAGAGSGSGGASAGTPGMAGTAGKGGTSAGTAGVGIAGVSGSDAAGGTTGEAGDGGSTAAGRGGASGAGAAGNGGSAGTTGGCAGRDLILCEDFETTALGEVPDGWERRGDLAHVADDDAHGGERSLKLDPEDNAERRIARDATVLGSAHWGRIHYKVQTPVPEAFVHSTMVSLIGEGPDNGRSDYRPIDTVKQAVDTPDVGGRHNWIYNVQIIGGSEFGRETQYDYTFDGEWHCAEYRIDASDQSYTFYWDGEEQFGFENGAGNYDRSDIPDEFEEIRVGWINYQSAPPGFTVWIDDIAFDEARIGCD